MALDMTSLLEVIHVIVRTGACSLGPFSGVCSFDKQLGQANPT